MTGSGAPSSPMQITILYSLTVQDDFHFGSKHKKVSRTPVCDWYIINMCLISIQNKDNVFFLSIKKLRFHLFDIVTQNKKITLVESVTNHFSINCKSFTYQNVAFFFLPNSHDAGRNKDGWHDPPTGQSVRYWPDDEPGTLSSTPADPCRTTVFVTDTQTQIILGKTGPDAL